MDVRPLGFEWRPRGRVAKVVSIGSGAVVGVCLVGALGLLVGSAADRALEALAGEEAMVAFWARAAALAVGSAGLAMTVTAFGVLFGARALGTVRRLPQVVARCFRRRVG